MKKSQFLDSLMDKDVGWSPVAFHFFFFFLFNLLILSSLFLILCTHGYIFLNLAYVYSTNTDIETNIMSISQNNSLHAG